MSSAPNLLDARLPALRNREDLDYSFFVEGLRGFAGGGMSVPAAQGLHAALGSPGAPVPRLDRSKLRGAGDPLPALATRNRLLRSSQQMMWRRLVESYGARRAEIEAAIVAAESNGPGSLEWAPDFPVPQYAKAAFHQQPDGYQGDLLTGAVYHYGTKIFFVGSNDDDRLHEGMAAAAERPADGVVRRVLDIGCSIGQCTTGLKAVHPLAEVTGIDVSAPFVRYAHARAVQLGSDVHFKQRSAESTGFPDQHFDMVLSMIVFHEVPWTATQRIVREMHRVLRPGGTFTVFDFPSGLPLPPSLQYFLDIDAQFNGEPWSTEFIYGDFAAEMRAAGFELRDAAQVGRYLRGWVGTKPA